MLSRLGLGTVQFGSHYGVSNEKGAPVESEVAAILASAEEAGIGYLDTAFGYPKAEELVGRYLQPGHRLKVVTKTPPIGESVIEEKQKRRILDALAVSMDRLKIAKVHGLLVHHTRDLHKPGREYLVEALQEARSCGLVDRIGVSVYDAAQLESVENILDLEIVQFPYNAFDTRVVTSDVFRRLKSVGAEMHARSIFLQGLLLMDRSRLPDYFVPVRKQLSLLDAEWAAVGVSRLSGCLRFVLQNRDVDALIVGTNSLAEFQEIQKAISEADGRDFRVGAGSELGVEFIDPSRWPSFAR
jgi:aryl-alcohol dehydrogenase-like predicted oxidoreductase